MDKLEKVEEKLQKVEKKVEEDTLAMEMLKELKSQSKRKDVIIIILIGVILAMIIAFFIHENQYETVSEETEQYITQEQTDTNNSNMSGVIN